LATVCKILSTELESDTTSAASVAIVHQSVGILFDVLRESSITTARTQALNAEVIEILRRVQKWEDARIVKEEGNNGGLESNQIREMSRVMLENLEVSQQHYVRPEEVDTEKIRW
jgi:hypothetical protein